MIQLEPTRKGCLNCMWWKKLFTKSDVRFCTNTAVYPKPKVTKERQCCAEWEQWQPVRLKTETKGETDGKTRD